MSSTTPGTAPAWAPTFIGIGPGKSGTTWLYSTLARHPEVGMSSVKETLFFSEQFERGVDWYQRFFRDCAGKRAIGEVSNTYIFSDAAPERIARFRPDMRLISFLRNPVDRTFSHYLFWVRNGTVQGTFEEAIEQHPDLMMRGQYARILDRWLAHFPREQLMLHLFEDFRANPAATAQSVYAFVGVDPTFHAAGIEKRELGAAVARSTLVARVVKQTSTAVRALGLPEIVQRVKDGPLPRLLYRAYAPEEYPKMRPETRQRLRDFFAADTQRLGDLLGRNLDEVWT